MTLDEAKSFLGDRYVLSPNYRIEDCPQHSLYEPVNVRLTFAHVKHRSGAQDDLTRRHQQ